MFSFRSLLRGVQNIAPTAESSRKQHDYARHNAAHAPKDTANTLTGAVTLLLTQGTAAGPLPSLPPNDCLLAAVWLHGLG